MPIGPGKEGRLPMKVPRTLVLLAALPLMLIASGGSVAAASGAGNAALAAVTSSSLGTYSPTFTGPAATGCATPGCSLLTGPFFARSTAAAARGHAATGGATATAHALRAPNLRRRLSAADLRRLSQSGTFPVPSVSCAPLGAGCDRINPAAGGATAAKGLDAVDSARHTTNKFKDVEPPDQGLCAGNGFVTEINNIGEILVFNTALKRKSAPISLDTVMGLAKRHWSSGGDTSCIYDPANGGHWFFTEFASASPESQGGPFAGCFAAVANTCYEGIAVSKGSSPFGPYNVYFLNANYDPSEPGYPFLLNDFAKISVTRDAFLLFYDEFPLNTPGIGGGFFNGAQEFAFDKNALERGLPVKLKNGAPNPSFTVARENMGLVPTPDGTCARDKILHQGGITCWAAVIPAQPVAGQFDNSHGGSGFMLSSLDFYGFAGSLPTSGDNRIATWAWTGLSALNSSGCSSCGGIQFRGQLFSGVDRYFDPEFLTNGFPASLGAQKAGPIPLGRRCGVLSGTTGPCPEGGIASNGDFMTQVAQAQGQLWGGTATQIAQTYSNADSEIHQGAVYWTIGTNSFDTTGTFTLTNQGYVTAQHEDLEFPSIAAEGAGGNGKAILDFTLNGDGGPTGADHGGFYPSSAFGRLTSSSNGLLNSTINIANLGKSPQDGFSEYQGYPGATSPRWGDYSWALFLPGSGGRIYFANEYIPYRTCTGKAFHPLAIGICGGTRDGQANWGTSVNYVVP
jgi:hypothetical protein